MRPDRILFALALLSPLACKMVTEGDGKAEESSSSGDASDTTASDSLDDEGTSDGTDEDVDPTTDSGGSSGDEDDEASESSSGSTGESSTDFALHFDGSSYARMSEVEPTFAWPSSDFTVEAWVEIHDTNARGIIFDTANVQFSDGWVLYLHSEYNALVFSFFDENHQNQVVMGPDIEDIGTGWHHFAATKSDDTVFIHVDGVTKAEQQVPSTLSFDDSTLWSLGGSPDDNPDFRLTDVTVDDLRISGFARYESDFDPLPAYDDDESVILLLLLDAGDGDVATDETRAVDFDVENPEWVPGNAE